MQLVLLNIKRYRWEARKNVTNTQISTMELTRNALFGHPASINKQKLHRNQQPTNRIASCALNMNKAKQHHRLQTQEL